MLTKGRNEALGDTRVTIEGWRGEDGSTIWRSSLVGDEGSGELFLTLSGWWFTGTVSTLLSPSRFH